METDAHIYEKRHICMWKETHMDMKRDIHIYEKRHTYL